MIFSNIDNIDKLSAFDLRVIILGLKVANFNINDEEMNDTIVKEISSLPSAEKINTLLEEEESFRNLRRKVGEIISTISKYSKRDIENRDRYKAKTGLNPRYKVLDYINAENKSNKVHKQAGWWENISKGITDTFGGKQEETVDVVKQVSSNLFKARESLYDSYREVLKSLFDARQLSSNLSGQEADVIKGMVDELEDSIKDIKDPMVDLNWSLEKMNNFVEEKKQEIARQHEEASKPKTEVKETVRDLTDEETLERARKIQESREEEIRIEEEEKKQQRIRDAQEKVNNLGLSLDDVYYSKFSGFGEIRMIPVKLDSIEINEKGMLQATNVSTGKNIFVDPMFLKRISDVLNVVNSKFSQAQNNEEREQWNSLSVDINRAIRGESKFPSIPAEKAKDVLASSKNRVVFNIKKMAFRIK